LNLRVLLEEMIEKGASDLHITAGDRPKLRVDGDIVNSSIEVSMQPKDTLQLAYSVLTENQKKRFEMEDELDFSFGIQNLARFRGNCFKQRGCVSMVIRQIPFNIRTFEDLGLPRVIADLSDKPRGLILVTGPTGSGKSTTLAAMLDRINRSVKGHMITIEDPIEFIHKHQQCIVNQREVGSDTKSFQAALKYALRQDPDIVLIGEMRDLETIQAGLTIAETGHLAFATLHTNSAAEAVNRIIDVFPSHQQSQVRAQLAFCLEGIITQTLLPKIGGRGRAMAAEILVVTPAIRALIRDDKIHQIYSMMQSGKKYGMQTMNDGLYNLYMSKTVSLDEVLRASHDTAELMRMIGITPENDGKASPAMAPPSSTTNHGETPRRVSSATASRAAVPLTSSSEPKLSHTSCAGTTPRSSSRSTASLIATRQPLSSRVPRPQTAPSWISAEKGGCCHGAVSSTGTTSRCAIRTTGRAADAPAQRKRRPWVPTRVCSRAAYRRGNSRSCSARKASNAAVSTLAALRSETVGMRTRACSLATTSSGAGSTVTGSD